MEKLYAIIQGPGVAMSKRPEFYSGRGATTSDLTDKILFNIYDGIVRDFGKPAADNFVKMVDDIKVMSATTFLQELYALHNAGWKYKKKKEQAPGLVVDKDSDGNYDIAHGMVSMMSMFAVGGRDQTADIKNHFLRSKGVKMKEEVYVDSFGYVRRS